MGAKALATARWWMSRKSAAAADKSGARLGRLIHRLSKGHRRKALTNLELAFPEMSPSDREALALRTFEHWGRFIVEFLRLGSTDAVTGETPVMKGIELVDQALAAGKGVIIVGGHFGRWVPGIDWWLKRGGKVNVVVREPNNPNTVKLADDLWKKLGVETIARGDAARAMLRKLKNNELVIVLADQNSEEVFVPFFGKPCGTVMGPAVISKRSGAPILMSHGLTNREGKYELRVEPIIEPLPGYEDSTVGITAAFNAKLEALIREFPEQYLWLHDRWKSARRRGML